MSAVNQQVTMRDVVLYLWSRHLVERRQSRSKVRPGAIHEAIAAVEEEIRSLGVPLLFHQGPEHRHSRQVSAAIDELTPFGIKWENPVFACVLEDRPASRHLEFLAQRLPPDARNRLDDLVARFGARLEAAAAELNH